MQILNRLERKFGRFAIRDLIVYIVGLNALVYVLSIAYPQSAAISKLVLDPELIMRGEVWRLFTYVFIPPSASILWIFFILYFYYIVGIGLEREWGSFRFNIYYFTGMIATALAAFTAGQGTTALYLNLSLFLAFAHIYPDFEILLFFVIPVKVKYLAWLNWAFIALTVLTAPLADKVAALVSISNYFLFFGNDILLGVRQSRSAYRRRKRFAPLPQRSAIHRCAVCNMTEKDDPQMEFRYCSTCEGDYEYCMKHLKTHEHVKSAESGKEPRSS
jgi:membrane associated rhomboid family serine protease